MVELTVKSSWPTGLFVRTSVTFLQCLRDFSSFCLSNFSISLRCCIGIKVAQCALIMLLIPGESTVMSSPSFQILVIGVFSFFFFFFLLINLAATLSIWLIFSLSLYFLCFLFHWFLLLSFFLFPIFLIWYSSALFFLFS